MAADLIEEFGRGNEVALADVFYKYNPSLIHFAIKYTKDEDVAEEIVSDCFVKAWTNRAKFANLENLRAFCMLLLKMPA